LANVSDASTPRKPPGADDNFAANLRQRRELLGLSQEAVAEKMQKMGHSFHQATIYKLESGTRRVQLTEAIDLAKVLDTTVNELTQDPENRLLTWRVQLASQQMHRTYLEMVELYRNYKDRQAILRYAIEDYKNEGAHALDNFLDEYEEEATRPMATEAFLIELKYHMLDSGPNSVEFEGELNRMDLTPEQKAVMATWEAEKAELALGIAQERLEYARAIEKKLNRENGTAPKKERKSETTGDDGPSDKSQTAQP
jgi:transcriptional regulator with XRE-family HTH domain